MAVRAPFGQRVRRVEDPRFLRGATQYVGGIALPGMLSVAFARSVEAHARLRAVDVSRARAHPGVHRVLANEEA
ncbi:MAG TPA: hypothetical protein VIY27_13105, partial [Myxococcota bacterium]